VDTTPSSLAHTRDLGALAHYSLILICTVEGVSTIKLGARGTGSKKNVPDPKLIVLEAKHVL